MNDFLLPILLIGVYVLVMGWILPRLGVPT